MQENGLAGGSLAEEGAFDEITLPEIIVRIWKWNFSGGLRVDHRKVLRIITFKDGNVVGLTSDNSEESLDEYIRRSGKLSPDQISALIERKPIEQDMAAAFVESGLLSARECEQIQRLQLVSVMASMLSAGADGRYKVQPSRIEWEGPIQPTPALLLDALMACEDRHWISERLPMDALFEPGAGGGTSASYVPAEAMPILRLADGEHSVEDICRSSSRENFFVCKLLYGLELLGVVQRRSPASDKKRGRRLLARKESDGSADSLDPARPTTVLESLAAQQGISSTFWQRAIISATLVAAATAGYLIYRYLSAGGDELQQPPPQPTFFSNGAPPPQTQPAPAPETQPTPAEPVDPAVAAVRAGDIDTAAAISQDRLLRAGLNLYTTVLEIDCQAASVQEAYIVADESAALFVLPTIHNGRKCYNVCWGLYKTWVEAQKDSTNMPRYFREQGGHKVVRLADLLVTD